MATSGSTTVQIFSWISMKFAWEQVSQSIANNTTTIKWTLSATTTSGGAVYVSNRKWAVTIDGTEYTGTVKVSLDKGSTQTLASDTVTIKHNESGSKSFAYSFSQQFNLTLNSGKYMGTYEGSGTGTLDSIPRLSTMTVTGGELGKAKTITVTRKADSFTHSIKAECGSTTFYIKADGTTTNVPAIHNATSIKWTPSFDLATEFPQKDGFSIKFTITTHYMAQSIGTNQTTATYSLPAEYLPSFSYSATDICETAATIQQYIQGRSAIKVDITAQSSYGAWIKSCAVRIEGKTYTVAKAVDGVWSVQTDTISGSGDITMTITVKDSRDRVATTDRIFNVLPYKIPRITQLYPYRCDDDQLKDPQGNNIGIKFMAECAYIPMSVVYTLKYKKPSDTRYTEIKLDEYTDETLINDGYYLIQDVGDTSIEIILSVQDSFSAAVTETMTAPGLKKFISLMKKNGDIVGIAINKVAELEGVIDLNFPLKLSAGLYDGGSLAMTDEETDKVIEYGETDGWLWRKWESGMAECRKTVAVSTAISTAWGTMYVGTTKMSRQSYPFVFTAKPLEVASVTTASNAVWLFAESGGNGVNGAYQTAIYNVCRPSAVSAAATYYITIDAKGRWK